MTVNVSKLIFILGIFLQLTHFKFLTVKSGNSETTEYNSLNSSFTSGGISNPKETINISKKISKNGFFFSYFSFCAFGIYNRASLAVGLFIGSFANKSLIKEFNSFEKLLSSSFGIVVNKFFWNSKVLVPVKGNCDCAI